MAQKADKGIEGVIIGSALYLKKFTLKQGLAVAAGRMKPSDVQVPVKKVTESEVVGVEPEPPEIAEPALRDAIEPATTPDIAPAVPGDLESEIAYDPTPVDIAESDVTQESTAIDLIEPDTTPADSEGN